MAPHVIILGAAFLLGAAGKFLFPRSSIRVALAAAAAVVVGLSAYLHEWPTSLGLFLITSGSLVGAVLGVIASKLLMWLVRRAQTPLA